jgi:sigma-B regulation protein RsbU (phosphoserine phosphatase)
MKTRILLGLIAVVLLVTALVTFYTYVSSPTDENLFADSPGKLMFAAPLPISAEGGGIRTGDVLLGVNGVYSKGKSTEEVREQLLRSLQDSIVVLEVYRAGDRMTYTYHVHGEVLRRAPLESVDSTVVVVGVTPGGASDRAGMLVGDFIEKINGQNFGTAMEADRILRRAQSGGSFTYEIIRGGDRLTLNVVLATFGIPLANLIFTLAGFIYLGIGAFIAVKRPQLKAACLLGLSFMLYGFVIAVWAIRRDPDPTLFVLVRAGGMAVALFFAIAVAWHAGMYFPHERQELISRRWITAANYSLAFVLTGVTIFLGARSALDGVKGIILLFILMLILVIYNVVVRIRFLRFRSTEYRAQRQIVSWTSIAVGIVSTSMVVTLMLTRPNQTGFVGLPLIFIPLSYLYTIGRYRLLDLNLRIRRNVQYTLVSVGWGLFCVVLAIEVLSILLSAKVHIPSVSLHGTSIEVSDLVFPGEGGGPTERFLFMTRAVVIWFVLWKGRRGGQRVIDKRYYRTRYDYRRALGELSEVLATKLSMADLGRGIVEKIVQFMQLKRAGVFFFRERAVCCCREAYGIKAGMWDRFCAKDDHTFVQAVEQFEGEFSVDYLPEPLKNEFRDMELGYIIPIRSKERLIGAIAVGEKLSEATFSQEDLEFLSAAARQASVSIENAFLYEELAEQERMKHELEIARRIQMASLPQHTPTAEGLDIAGMSRPALEVGGDFFDYLNGSDKAMTIIVGDVSGKGTSAALYMSKIQGILRSLYDYTKSPAELFIRTNRLLRDDLEKSSFITALGAAFDTSTRNAVVARAGHLPLYRYRPKDGSVGKILTRGLGLGLDDGTIFAAELEERSFPYEPGDVMAFVTDGIIEARNEQGEEFGEAQLLDLLRCNAVLTAAEIRGRILETVSTFAGSVPQHDDQTLVVVKVN